MAMEALVLPGPLLCGSCGWVLDQNRAVRGHLLQVRCSNPDCLEQGRDYEIVLRTLVCIPVRQQEGSV
jgi:hypothetical protein